MAAARRREERSGWRENEEQKAFQRPANREMTKSRSSKTTTHHYNSSRRPSRTMVLSSLAFAPRQNVEASPSVADHGSSARNSVIGTLKTPILPSSTPSKATASVNRRPWRRCLLLASRDAT